MAGGGALNRYLGAREDEGSAIVNVTLLIEISFWTANGVSASNKGNIDVLDFALFNTMVAEC